MNIRGWVSVLLCAGLSGWLSVSNATLTISDGGFTATDDDSNLMWLTAPGPDMGWESAVEWAASLTVGGYKDWRLPSALTFDLTKIDLGFRSTSNEFGHLYGIDLGVAATGQYPGSIKPLVGYIDQFFWTDTAGTDEDAYAFNWSTEGIWQIRYISDYERAYHVTAVRTVSSDPQPIPEPGSLILIGLGLTGLFMTKRRRQFQNGL